MAAPLKVVDGLRLSDDHKKLLRPGERVNDASDRVHILPRFFYEVATWEQAKTTKLTAHFTLAELMAVDCREADLLFHTFPHYVPCGVSVLARYLEEFRVRVEAPVMVHVNGAYRSPSHSLVSIPSPHEWAAAVDIYRIGDTYMDSSAAIEKYARIAESIGQEVTVKHFGSGADETDDHLHFDLGYLHLVPARCDEGE